MDLTFDLEPGDDVVYLAEASEQIERIESGLLELERDAANDETLAEIFRAAHTLKGSAATIGHARMAELTHALEEVFGALRSGLLRDLTAFEDLLLPTVDVLRILVDEVVAGHTLTDEPAPLARRIIDRLAVALDEGRTPDLSTPDGGPGASTSGDAIAIDAVALERLLEESAPAVGPRTLVTFAVDGNSDWSDVRMLQGLMAATETGRLLGSVPSIEEIEAGTGGALLLVLLSGDPTAFDGLLARLLAMDDALRADARPVDETATTAPTTDIARAGASVTRPVAAHTIRIDVAQLDDLMNLVGELIVQKTRLRLQSRQLAARLGEDVLATEAQDGARHFAQIIDRLQSSVTDLRMMPFETVFSRFPRLVRDLSAQLGKEVTLTLDGRETELDRSLLEEVGDPIGHLIRNAIDHGLEPGPERLRAGKPERGTIGVTARHADGRVIVEVADDGRGMDPLAIARAAVEHGVIDQATAATMTDAEALRLVFQPGFSTAREITDVSGRGVGMDVVRTNVERLGGHVTIRSTLGTGTTIAMSLPLTLAIIDALLVRSGQRVCAIPLRSVIETQRVEAGQVETVAAQPVINLPRGVVRLQPLDEAMGDPGHQVETGGFVRAVLVRSHDAELALGVDEFLGTEEIVLKSLGLPGEQPTGVVGATILADGGVALVLDVDRLVGPERTYPLSA